MSVNGISYPTLPYPRQIRLDTISRCNAKCLSCHRNIPAVKAQSGLMCIDTIIQVIKDIASADQHPDEIVPVNYGEFFMHPDWPSILSALETYLPGTGIVLPTNGALLNQKALSVLVEVKTLKLINFSINAFFADTYQRFMGFNHEVMARILEANEYIKAKRPEVIRWASMVFDPEYQTDLERDLFMEFWYGKVNWVWTLPAANCGRKPVAYTVQVPCRSLFDTLVISRELKLGSCCFDAGFTLDIGEWNGSVITAWTNPKLAALRLAHNEGKRAEYPTCAGCSFA